MVETFPEPKKHLALDTDWTTATMQYSSDGWTSVFT